MKLVSISDTHCRLRKMTIPDGDVLLHSGDLTFQGDIAEISQELREFERLKSRFKNIVLICGNHDWLGERNPTLMRQMCDDVGVTYLQDEAIVVDGINIYGSPWQPEFCRWAFNLPRGAALKDKWDAIPQDTDVLLTHGPPYGVLDGVQRFGSNGWYIEKVGCEDLVKKVLTLPKLKIHQFGHIHSGYGTYKFNNINFINASSCDEQYKPVNKPIETEI
jgi:Icc-related predicted phosphoesterase